jgi:hypothetical protein
VPYDIFIAHAGADAAVAENLYDELVALGVDCFLDTKCLRLGDDWNVRLPEAQRESQATVVLVSDKCDRAFYHQEEVTAAIDLARASASAHRVIPFYITEPHVPDIPYGLRSKHGLYLTRESTMRAAARRLAESFLPLTPPILIPAQTLTHDIDLCICLDLSSSLDWLVALMRQQLLTLGFDIANAMAEKGKSIGRLRIISLWTDRDCTPSADLTVLMERWSELDYTAKRLLLFAPNTPTWETVATDFANSIWFPVGEGGGLTELEHTEILDAIANSI